MNTFMHIYLRNKFHFSDIHQSMSTGGRMEVAMMPKGHLMTTFQGATTEFVLL